MKVFLLLPFAVLIFFSHKEDAPFIVAAGDISCPQKSPGLCQGRSVYNAMPKDPDAVLALGDLVQGIRPSKRAYVDNFFSTWPVQKSSLYPVPGNHDYRKDRRSASGYKSFLQKHGLEARSSWYSENIGSWKIIALDSNCNYIDCSPGSRQITWLQKTLQESPQCTLAFFHHPLFHGQKDEKTYRGVLRMWRLLEKFGVDIALHGHWHSYERFPRFQSVRPFIVGTGGVSLFRRPAHSLAENSAHEFGFLGLHLRSDDYSWNFTNNRKEIVDSGTDTCSS